MAKMAKKKPSWKKKSSPYTDHLQARKDAGNSHHARGCRCSICEKFPHPEDKFPEETS